MGLPVSPAADPLLVRGEATFSPCQRYRYTLTRVFLDMLGSVQRPDKPVSGEGVTWLLLNPSTADAQFNDPTISKCCRFTRYWGYSELTIVNLFAWRSTDPRQLKTVESPVGPDNDTVILNAVADSCLTICGWGANGRLKDRGKVVVSRLLEQDLGGRLHALRWGKAVNPATAEPWHPLYLPEDLRPMRWQTAEVYRRA